MGLVNKRTMNKARDLALKNKDRIAAGVTKATGVIDEKTGGKHRDKLKKLDDAAAKFAGHEPGADAATDDEAATATPEADSTSDPTTAATPDPTPDGDPER